MKSTEHRRYRRGATGGVTFGAILCCLVCIIAAPRAAAAQERPTPPRVTTPELPPPLPISPGRAFLRALLIPGWGHAAIGSYTRGGFYVAAQSATIFTLLRTRSRIGEAQRRVRFREEVLLGRLAAGEVTDPDDIATALDDDETLGEMRGLLEARKDQQEDLVALGLFLILISGVDAYVSAHLARFPEPLSVSMQTAPTETGAVDLSLRFALPR